MLPASVIVPPRPDCVTIVVTPAPPVLAKLIASRSVPKRLPLPPGSAAPVEVSVAVSDRSVMVNVGIALAPRP
ncbi:hypothetical protein DK412_28530 [Methylobacterium sp. 17Sr1-1]|nr:hypothetical protein DK412_28530 [Methylobacterium sp. 17Sr1-1]